MTSPAENAATVRKVLIGWPYALRALDALEAQAARVEELEAALRGISEQQPKTVDWLRSNGIIFDGPLGTDPDDWENVAFSIYSDLCEVGSIARAALDKETA